MYDTARSPSPKTGTTLAEPARRREPTTHAGRWALVISRERGITRTRLAEGVTPVSLDVVVEQLAAGKKALWQ